MRGARLGFWMKRSMAWASWRLEDTDLWYGFYISQSSGEFSSRLAYQHGSSHLGDRLFGTAGSQFSQYDKNFTDQQAFPYERDLIHSVHRRLSALRFLKALWRAGLLALRHPYGSTLLPSPGYGTLFELFHGYRIIGSRNFRLRLKNRRSDGGHRGSKLSNRLSAKTNPRKPFSAQPDLGPLQRQQRIRAIL